METKNERMVREALGFLPQKAKKIARFMESSGIKGLEANPSLCPVAVYLRDYLPEGAYVAVGGDVAILHESELHLVRIPLPPAVQRFTARFDLGKYPNLREK